MSDQQSDEISLIDLVAVLVRYRRLVLGLPVVVAVVAAVWLYGVPMFAGRGGTAEHEVVVERELVFEPIPTRVAEYFDRQPHELVERLLEDVRVVAPVYASVDWTSAGMRTFEPGDEAALRAYVRASVIGERLTREWSQADRTLLVRFRLTDETAARAFLDGLLRQVRGEFAAAYATELSRADRAAAAELRAVESTLRLLDTAGVDDRSAGGISGASAAVEVLASATVAREVIAELRADTGRAFAVSEELLVYADSLQTGQSRSVRLVVAVLASAFFAIFLSFVLNYVRMVRADSDSMQTLSQAWKRE